jgi:hypothetical protein
MNQDLVVSYGDLGLLPSTFPPYYVVTYLFKFFALLSNTVKTSELFV